MATSHSTAYLLPIQDFPGYAVSQDGKVWSNRVRGHANHTATSWKRLSSTKTGDVGYLTVFLCRNKKRRAKKVHRLVLETFHGPCPLGMQGCHNDGDPNNNHLSNLRWGTPKENANDRDRHDSTARGNSHGNSKLTTVRVTEIRKRLAEGETGVSIAKSLNVSVSTISLIKKNKIWV